MCHKCEIARRDCLDITKVKVILFMLDGKYYGIEEWRIPENAIGPQDMINSPDAWRVSGSGPVLVPAQEPWGYPHLLF